MKFYPNWKEIMRKTTPIRLRRALKSKTIWFAMILAALSVLQDFIGFIDLDPRKQAIIGVAVAVIIVILRYMTTGPVDEK